MTRQQSRRPENPKTAATISLAAGSMVTEPTDKPLTRLAWLYGLADASRVPHPVMACAVAIVRRSYPRSASALDVDELAAATGYTARTVRRVINGLERNGWLELVFPGCPSVVMVLGDDGRRVFREVLSPSSYHLTTGSPVWIGRS
jgi:hypothetical protein